MKGSEKIFYEVLMVACGKILVSLYGGAAYKELQDFADNLACLAH